MRAHTMSAQAEKDTPSATAAERKGRSWHGTGSSLCQSPRAWVPKCHDLHAMLVQERKPGRPQPSKLSKPKPRGPFRKQVSIDRRAQEKTVRAGQASPARFAASTPYRGGARDVALMFDEELDEELEDNV